MTFHAHDLMDSSIREPTTAQMRALLQSLADSDDEHPDVALAHETEWCLSAFRSGLLILENLESDEDPQHMRDVSQERMLELWQMLAAGRISELRALPWLAGQGVA